MAATLGIAAIVCCVASTSGDVCNDLKTGQIVGASPFRQQYMQIAGVVVASFVMAPVMSLLHNTVEGGIGGRELSAPQASLFAALARGFSGETELPWHLLGVGAVIGVIILVIDKALLRNGSGFRAHLMPIAVGMYLPFGVNLPILIGGLIAWWHSRRHPKNTHDSVLHLGVLFSSGVIAGEALTSVVMAGFIALGVETLYSGGPSQWISVLAAVAVIMVFFRQSKPRQ
jgi:putative OPT family oligopeptide transporter